MKDVLDANGREIEIW